MAKNAVFDLFGHNVICARYKQSVERKKYLLTDRYYQEEEMDANELSILIDIAIDKMPPKRKSVFVMSRQRGMSHKEIADQMRISTKTVENHIAQALVDIRKAIS